MKPGPLDNIWVTSIVLVNVLYFIRKAILAKHGYRWSPFDLFEDWKRMKKVIDEEEDLEKRHLYVRLNRSIPILFVFTIVFFVILHAIVLKDL